MCVNEYDKQANDFLDKHGVSCNIERVGLEVKHDWDSASHMKYRVTLKRLDKVMSYDFFDSIHNTGILTRSKDEWARKIYGRFYEGLSTSEKNSLNRLINKEKEKATPGAYDVLACLVTSDPGIFDDFCNEFGYDSDSVKAFNIYRAVQEQYRDLCRVFTQEQLEELGEIW